MIKVFYGENRVRVQKEAQKFLGDNYEMVEGENLMPQDLPSLMMGNSLFAETRAILVRDALANKAIWEDLPKYLDSPHRVVFWESKIDRRSSIYKSLKDRVQFQEFKLPRDLNQGLVFEIYKTAKRDGTRAVELLKKVEHEQEPMMFLGLMVSQAIRDYSARPGVKEKRALKELSELDMQLKTTKLQPWTLISAFLLRLAS